MAAKKPEPLFESPKLTCAAHPMCRFPGRLWISSLQAGQRVCVVHYYQAIDKDTSIYRDDVVPPKGAGVIVAKPVAGA